MLLFDHLKKYEFLYNICLFRFFSAISGLSGADFDAENEKFSNMKYGQDARSQIKLNESVFEQNRSKKLNSSIQSGKLLCIFFFIKTHFTM